MELLRRLNGVCQALSLVPGNNVQPVDFDCHDRGNQNEKPGHFLTQLNAALLHERLHSGSCPPPQKACWVTCAHHGSNSCFPSSELGACRCQWEHCVQGCRERLSAVDVVIMHLVLFSLKELPEVTKEMNPNQKETNQNGSPGCKAPEEQQCTDCGIFRNGSWPPFQIQQSPVD